MTMQMVIAASATTSEESFRPEPFNWLRTGPVEGLFEAAMVVRQAHHEREKPAHHDREESAHHERQSPVRPELVEGPSTYLVEGPGEEMQ